MPTARLGFLLILFVPGVLAAADPAADPEFFEAKVRPVLVEHCQKCHGDNKGKEPKGGLRVDARAYLLKGGDSGPAIVPGDAEKSKLIEAVRFENADLQMPPKGKLPAAAIADLTAWVKAGAVWPGSQEQAAVGPAAFDLAKRKAEHWAWKPVGRPAVPAVRDTTWPLSSVDRFILAGLENKGLRPAAAGERRVWIRRVTFDLIGLPPTPAEVEAYLADRSTEAEARVVERLLESPHFGERWGRHWLDLVRYAETRGHEFDPPIPNAFQYRDYVIRALNADVPYNQFVREHVAGDLLENPRLHPTEKFNESILGTGFWFLGEEVHSPVDIRQDQADRFDNRIDVLTKTFLGLTVSCARCHDHKFDAISQKDYYALYGIIQSSAYRLARFDSLDANRRIASELAAVNRASAKEVAAALADAARPAVSKLADYLMAAREATRSGVAFGSGGTADIVFEDFESGTYANWTATGTAFGDRPQTLQTIGSYQGKINAGGKYFVNSHNIRDGGDVAKGDAHTGRLTSKEFAVGRKFITMLVGGGSTAGKTCVNLLIDGKAVRTATGRNDNQMYPVRWDVRDLAGKTARIEIVDEGRGGWGNVGADDIVFTDRAESTDLPPTVRAADFAESFRGRITEAARARKLDPDLLTGWVELVLRASRSADDPLHRWAQVCLDQPAVKRSTTAPPAEVVIDYATAGLTDWLPDEGSFGTGPTRPGVLRLVGEELRFADYSAAEFDRAWEGLATAPGTVNDTGAIGKRIRAGSSIRTPLFTLKAGRLHYLVRGAGSAYAAVAGHTLINGPLHGQLVTEFKSGPGFRWVTHDLTAYKGQPAHVEFTANDGNFAVAMVVQGEQPPPTPAEPVVTAEGKTPEDLAGEYQRIYSAVLERWKASPPSTVADARLANALLGHPRISSKVIDEALESFVEKREELTRRIVASSRLAPAMWDGPGFNERLFIRGSPKGIGDEVPRRFLEGLAGPTGISSPGSGRLELARQITDPVTNPFIARVMVNRVWHHLFGRGLVGPVDNFGVLGEPPTHPELLDFLADRFVRDGWSVKRLIRDLVLSRTYRMSSIGDPAATAADPQNLLLHRARLRRLDGEAIRDSMLSVSGRLDRTAFGPSVPIHLTPFLDGRGRPTSGPLDGDGRRSIYLGVKRNFLSPMLLAFDTPIPFSTVGRRQVSNVPAQALILMNDPFVHQQAGVWAKRVLGESDSTDDRIRAMYLAAFCRPPTADETAACREFLTEQAGRYRTDVADKRPWGDLAHTLFNAKEFIYLD